MGEDDKIRGITPGKFTDFGILEADPYNVPKEQLKNIKVWVTVVGGETYPATEYRD